MARRYSSNVPLEELTGCGHSASPKHHAPGSAKEIFDLWDKDVDRPLVLSQIADFSPEWITQFRAAAEKLAIAVGSKRAEFARLGQLRGEVSGMQHRLTVLEHRVADLAQHAGTIVVPINTFAPEPYVPTAGPIHAVIKPVEDGYVASVHDVNVGASGSTVLEATENLKELLVFTLEDLSEEPPARLGRRAALQLEALRALIKKVD